jgi:hypothetical protein
MASIEVNAWLILYKKMGRISMGWHFDQPGEIYIDRKSRKHGQINLLPVIMVADAKIVF